MGVYKFKKIIILLICLLNNINTICLNTYNPTNSTNCTSQNNYTLHTNGSLCCFLSLHTYWANGSIIDAGMCLLGSTDANSRQLQESTFKISFGNHLKSQIGFDFIDFNKTVIDCKSCLLKSMLIYMISLSIYFL